MSMTARRGVVSQLRAQDEISNHSGQVLLLKTARNPYFLASSSHRESLLKNKDFELNPYESLLLAESRHHTSGKSYTGTKFLRCEIPSSMWMFALHRMLLIDSTTHDHGRIKSNCLNMIGRKTAHVLTSSKVKSPTHQLYCGGHPRTTLCKSEPILHISLDSWNHFLFSKSALELAQDIPVINSFPTTSKPIL